MRWQNSRKSENVEDRRGKRALATGGGIGILGLLAVLAISFLTKQDPQTLLQSLETSSPVAAEYTGSPEEEQLADMVRVTLGWTEDVWAQVYPQFARKYGAVNKQYKPTKLVLFSSRVQSACGGASAASGPFYCPADEQVYIDLSFYKTMRDRMGAPGDFAQAYVIAHEVGHHVQNHMGLLSKIQQQQFQLKKQKRVPESNQLQVRVELMADYLAGIWSYHVHKAGKLDQGDIEEAVNAANQIGDDTLQRNAGATVRPHTFTHGTSEQRKRWYAYGIQAASEGNYTKYDAFAVDYNRL